MLDAGEIRIPGDVPDDARSAALSVTARNTRSRVTVSATFQRCTQVRGPDLAKAPTTLTSAGGLMWYAVSR